MPELPEVETILRDLRPRLAGRRIGRARASRLLRCIPAGRGAVSSQPLRTGNRDPGTATFPQCLVGRRVAGLRRRGKYLLIGLDDGRELMVHLGMTGRLVLEPAGRSAGKHDGCSQKPTMTN